MFTTDQMVWIVQEATRVKSPTKLKREFLKIFNVVAMFLKISNVLASKLQCVQFPRVIAEFNKTGNVSIAKKPGGKQAPTNTEDIQKDEQPVSVNGDKYLDLLEETMRPAVRIATARKKLWFQQDGAPSRYTNNIPQRRVKEQRRRVKKQRRVKEQLFAVDVLHRGLPIVSTSSGWIMGFGVRLSQKSAMKDQPT